MAVKPPLIVLLLLSVMGTGAASKAELTGIITQMNGAVQATGPGVQGLPRASPWQVLRAGVTVQVPADAAAGIVCSNRRFVRIQGPATWLLTEPACAAGKELTPSEYALVAPQGGRFKVVEGLLTLEREMRSGDGDDPLAPLVLSPRNTVLRSPRPKVFWTRVPSVTEYEIRWSGRGASGRDILLKAGEVACVEEWRGLSVCSLPWPEERHNLPPRESFLLSIAARDGISAPWHANDPVEARTQEIAQALALESELRDLGRLGLENSALEVARAGLLAERGLYADAAELYRQAIAAAPFPELQITVADLDLAMGLHLLAEPRYREALADGIPSVRAAAAFGVGRVAYARGNYQESASFFRQARDLYLEGGLGEEEAAARKAMERAVARIPRLAKLLWGRTP
jgi:hypothetical protein